MTKEDTLKILHINAEDLDDLDDLFKNGIGLIQYFAVEKNIEFDGYFRAKWEIEAEHPMTFDEEYFENKKRSELFVFLAAEADKEVYECLQYVYNLTHHESLSEDILHREIYVIRESGVKF